MPARAASNGRHGSGATSSSALKPNSTLSHSVSTPARIAASTTPCRIMRSALAKIFALDEHAVATVRHGPRVPSAASRKRPSECGVCRAGERKARRQAAVFEVAITFFAGADARRRRADDERDAIGAIALDALARGVEEAVGGEPAPGQAIVAAVVAGKCRRKRLRLESRRPGRSRRSSGTRVKSLAASPPRSLRKASACARRPSPSAEVAVNAVIDRGAIRVGTRRRIRRGGGSMT